MIEGRLGNLVLCSSLRIPIHYPPRTCSLCQYLLRLPLVGGSYAVLTRVTRPLPPITYILTADYRTTDYRTTDYRTTYHPILKYPPPQPLLSCIARKTLSFPLSRCHRSRAARLGGRFFVRYLRSDNSLPTPRSRTSPLLDGHQTSRSLASLPQCWNI